MHSNDLIAAGSAPEFVTESDWIPGFWNFLLGLDSDDLISELVQNDLDQQATRTSIRFEPDRLVVEGNGRPVDGAGWERLRMIRGAGDQVAAKQGKIGVKNHGLKTAFTIGDQLELLSSGSSIVQTLYANGSDAEPHPGAYSHPLPNPAAPEQGCRVVVTYRRRDLEPQMGEKILLARVTPDVIDKMFTSSCMAIPELFAGIVSPDGVPTYEIALHHWRLGDAVFRFSCTKPRKCAGRIEVFRRSCEVSGTVESLPNILREEVSRRLLPLEGKLKQRVPDFYRRGQRFFVEVSWRINERGRPQSCHGQYRYPIGYPKPTADVTTGHGVFFSAPFISDVERHGPAWTEGTNSGLRDSCEALLLDAMVSRVSPQWGAVALRPLLPNHLAPGSDEIARQLLAKMAIRGAIPTVDWHEAMRALRLGRKVANLGPLRPRRAKAQPAARYGFVIPMTSSNENSIDARLAFLSPSSERQLDPRVDGEIVRLLADCSVPGFGDVFTTFEESDALDRALGNQSDFYDALQSRQAEFGNTTLASAYLSVIDENLDTQLWDSEDLKARLLVPDSNGQATPFGDLHAAALLPAAIPGLELPPLLHPDLTGHPLFRRKGWNLPKYTMMSFLAGGSLQRAGDATRRAFWQWLRGYSALTSQERGALLDIAVWPDTHRQLRTFTELCEPGAKIGGILGDAISRPHTELLRFKPVMSVKRGATALRRVPTRPELENWFEHRLDALPVGEPADALAVARLGQLEADLSLLFRERPIATLLRAMATDIPALAQDGSVQWRSALVVASVATGRLALPARYTLKAAKGPTERLQKVWPALPGPSVDMIVDALAEDGANFEALQARLHALFLVSNDADALRARLAVLPIIPVNGIARRPDELAMTGGKDYWGGWKTKVPAKALSMDAQKRYLLAGVTSASPDPQTSRSFFSWLTGQSQDVVESHVAMVVRHLLHAAGPSGWASSYPTLPIIPAKGAAGVRLFTFRDARTKHVYLRDHSELYQAILAADPVVMFAITHVQGVTEPITEILRGLGVRSLKTVAGEPARVDGLGNVNEPTPQLTLCLEQLKSRLLQNTLVKRLDDLGVRRELIRGNWHDRVSKIASIRLAGEVEAVYGFRGRSYRLHALAGLDPATGVFWVHETRRDLERQFCEAVAEFCIFKPQARPLDLLALQPALGLELNEESFGRPASADSDAPESETQEEEGAEAEEATHGHAPFDPDPAKNIPHPGPIPSGEGKAPRPPASGETRGKAAVGMPKAPTPALETAQIESLKTEHYASHCQVCVCRRTPAELAPVGSYVEWEEVRRSIVQAHHVHAKSGRGARHAGNLVLLCKDHHDNIGRRLTREMILGALAGATGERSVTFTAGEARTDLVGVTIEVELPDTGEKVPFFFTREHADYWLAHAHEVEGVLG